MLWSPLGETGREMELGGWMARFPSPFSSCSARIARVSRAEQYGSDWRLLHPNQLLPRLAYVPVTLQEESIHVMS